MISTLINLVNLITYAIEFAILAYCLLSWINVRGNSNYYRFRDLISRVVNPILNPCRRILGKFGIMGQIDLSPVVAIILVSVIRSIIVRGLILIHYGGLL